MCVDITRKYENTNMKIRFTRTSMICNQAYNYLHTLTQFLYHSVVALINITWLVTPSIQNMCFYTEIHNTNIRVLGGPTPGICSLKLLFILLGGRPDPLVKIVGEHSIKNVGGQHWTPIHIILETCCLQMTDTVVHII